MRLCINSSETLKILIYCPHQPISAAGSVATAASASHCVFGCCCWRNTSAAASIFVRSVTSWWVGGTRFNRVVVVVDVDDGNSSLLGVTRVVALAVDFVVVVVVPCHPGVVKAAAVPTRQKAVVSRALEDEDVLIVPMVVSAQLFNCTVLLSLLASIDATL